jgi:hypothetical protein
MHEKIDFKEMDTRLNEFLEKRNISEDLVNVHVFKQMWGSTCLGYGGIGGCAMTTAYTFILHDTKNNYVEVYPGSASRLGYSIEEPTDIFWEDVTKRNIKPNYIPLDEYGKVNIA